jgi:hypothetical protein
LRSKYIGVTDKYISKLYKYKEKLLEAGIDLDKYKIFAVSHTPISQSNRGSLNNSSMRSKSPNIANNMFKKRVRSIVKDEYGNQIIDNNGNAVFEEKIKNVDFVDKNLMKKMQKIYFRTVETISEKEYGLPDRIVKIRKYFQNKYPLNSNLEFKLELENGEEFDALYAAWTTARANGDVMPLNRRYFIKYKQTNGIDAGGLTKQFFSNISAQLQEKYFKLAYDGGNRYILNSKNKFISFK